MSGIKEIVAFAALICGLIAYICARQAVVLEWSNYADIVDWIYVGWIGITVISWGVAETCQP